MIGWQRWNRYQILKQLYFWAQINDPHNSGASARILNDRINNFIITAAPEQQVPESKADNNRDKDAPVEGHDSKHEHVSDRGVDAEQGRASESKKAPFTAPRGGGGGLGLEERDTNRIQPRRRCRRD